MNSEEEEECLGRMWPGNGGWLEAKICLERQKSLSRILLNHLWSPSMHFHCLDPRVRAGMCLVFRSPLRTLSYKCDENQGVKFLPWLHFQQDHLTREEFEE